MVRNVPAKELIVEQNHNHANLLDTYDQMILGQIINGVFTPETTDEKVNCFLNIANKMPINCARTYAQAAIFGNISNVLHFSREGKTICVKRTPTSKITIDTSESAHTILIDMKGVIVKEVFSDRANGADQLIDLTVQLPLPRQH